MAFNQLSLRGDIEELNKFFLTLLGEVGFPLIYSEESGAGFKMVGANRERVSQLIVTLGSMLWGYAPKNRVAVELEARREGAALMASLRGVSYLDILDIEAKEFTQSEMESCVRLVSLFSERLLERFG